MDTERIRKTAKEKNYLYSVLMDDYSVSKSVDKATNAVREKKPGKILDVKTAFDQLLGELETVCQEQLSLGESFYDEEKLSEARLVAKKVNTLKTCIKLVKKASDDWSDLGLDPRKQNKSSNIRIRNGLKTPLDAFFIPILESLVAIGGSGKVKDILEKVYERMHENFNKIDLEIIESVKEQRWRNTAKWARNKLREDGLLRADSPRGVWEISSDGEKYLNYNKHT
jgi:restriction system protein